ncbi:MAG: hypothetical protein ABJB66_03940 [Gemmatimonadaceae bacterium]
MITKPAATLLLGVGLFAGNPASVSAQHIPVRQLNTPAAHTVAPLGLFLGIKQLSDGRVIVDDAQNLRLLMFDSTLTKFSILADTTGKAGFNYGEARGKFTSYVGDSSLFSEQSSQTLLVLNPSGRVARITAAPKPLDVSGFPAEMLHSDAQGRLLYRGFKPRRTAAARPIPWGDKQFLIQHSDSSPIVRADFDTRKVDTLAWLKMPTGPVFIASQLTDGTYKYEENRIMPLSWVDDWTRTADGAIAIVRGQDYHIDWITPDGRVVSTPKMPFDWIRVTDADKRRLSDSARTVAESELANATKRAPLSPPTQPGSRQMTVRISPLDYTGTALVTTAKIVLVPLSEMPDYWPPVRFGSVLADLDSNVWILPTSTAQRAGGGIVYDVVNRSGQLFQRVQLPSNRSIAGFGPNGVIYLRSRDSALIWHLERTSVRR